jgi:6-phosphofructokinase 1
MIYENIDTDIPILGSAKITSPAMATTSEDAQRFVSDDKRILVHGALARVCELNRKDKIPPSFELAGPREKIFFDPSKIRCAVVTCGGLCPGLNAIIRSITLELHYGYGVGNIYGIQHGLKGFIPEYGYDVIELSPSLVGSIIKKGGSFLGSSRGPRDIETIVDTLDRMSIGALFMVGGDGTLMAASRIADAIAKRGLKISVVGIPKTIDNDIHMVARSFGFDTAVEVATQAIRAAHNEAKGYPNGIGLIKLMGRYSGFIAATATLAQQDVNFVLIPEVDFDLGGNKGFLNALTKRISNKSHAVIVVAEGAGQKFFDDTQAEKDPSGNVRLQDIGLYLKDEIKRHFQAEGMDASIKYIDPSYLIRSLPANANDQVFCNFLGRNAVHAAMAGKTRLLVGHWNDRFVHIPMSASAGKRKKVDPKGELWRSVLDATGQGALK